MERSLVPLMAQERRDDLWQRWPVAPTPSPRFPTHFRSSGAVRGTVPEEGDGESRQPGGVLCRGLLCPSAAGASKELLQGQPGPRGTGGRSASLG